MRATTLPSERHPRSWGAYYIMDMPDSPERERLRLAHLARRDEREIAYRAYWRALKEGRLVRPSACGECGKSCRPDGHHPDYAKPLEVLWLCCKCHRRAHAADVARIQALRSAQGIEK